jgi:vitamin B12 transporter
MTLALFSAFNVSAQSQQVATLGEVVVTASRNPQLLSAVSAHTTLITRSDIENSQATDVVTLLQREAGLQSVQNGGLGTTSSVFMRGLPSLDTLVLIDGVPQTKQDASGTVSLEHIMLDNVERIEVVRGNVSAIYGSGAIGGVIQIFTRAGSKESSATLGLEVGPRNTMKASANAGVSAGDTYLNAGVSRLTTDGFSAINTQQYTFANPDADGYQNTSSNLSINHIFSTDHKIGLQLSQSSGDTAVDSNYNGSLPTDTHFSTAKRNQTTVFSDNRFGTWRSRLSLSEQSQRDTFAEQGSYEALYGYNTRVQILSWVNNLPIGENWLGTAGVEEQQQHVDTASSDSPTYDINRVADAVFVGMEGSFGPLSVQINLRNDKIGDSQKDTSYLGLGYAITDALKLTASTSTAFNAPPLGYLYDPYSGNKLLKPEQAQSDEVGLQYAVGKSLLRATYFDTRVQDQLVYDFTTFAFANVARARNTGVEISFRGTVGDTEVRTSLTQQDPVNETTGVQLARRAKTMASVGVSQPIGAWLAGADLRYVGERNDSNSSTSPSTPVVLGAYTVLDATLAYRYSPQLTFKVRLDNVADTSYQTVYGYNQQPRSLYAGLTWTPKR